MTTQVCGQCTTAYAKGLPTCPHCGEETQTDMKVTKAGGVSWPPGMDPAGTGSSASTEQPEMSSNESEPPSQQPAPTTDTLSPQDQTDGSGAPSTDGDQGPELAPYESQREGTEYNGPYEDWLRDDLWNEASARGLQPAGKATKPDLISLLREDDQTTPM